MWSLKGVKRTCYLVFLDGGTQDEGSGIGDSIVRVVNGGHNWSIYLVCLQYDYGIKY